MGISNTTEPELTGFIHLGKLTKNLRIETEAASAYLHKQSEFSDSDESVYTENASWIVQHVSGRGNHDC